MSDQSQTTSGSSSNMLAFIVGALVVAVGVLGWIVYGGGDLDGSDDVTISIEGGGEAVEAIEGAVTGGE
ncbi:MULTISPECIES: hypothetical protein [unclassified Roseovarius]|uniref:hypothetical protein n=1 Tax=unclassified Roseovarius TaxID=2614913 RepID=UPI00273EBB26|nr:MULTISPECIES: hypothetical protein [unclassified Roseovarius]